MQTDGRNSVIVDTFESITFSDAWEIQKSHFDALLKGKLGMQMNDKLEQARNHLLLCEHTPVYTMGRNGSFSNVIEGTGLIKSEVVRTDRGGDITFHGPGQIVGYPILDLERFGIGLKAYVGMIEEVIIRTLSEFGITGGRLGGANGVWLDEEDPFRARKICAIGIKCSRYVTMHGFAFNISTDLAYFNRIIPCGIANKSVTSLEQELNRKVATNDVQEVVLSAFEAVFNCECIVNESGSFQIRNS